MRWPPVGCGMVDMCWLMSFDDCDGVVSQESLSPKFAPIWKCSKGRGDFGEASVRNTVD